jgi:diketogulonate reductase-like aldo/keto reductase
MSGLSPPPGLPPGNSNATSGRAPSPHDRFQLRSATKHTVAVSLVSVGAKGWGSDNPSAIRAGWEKLHAAGLNCIDTCPADGNGRAEQLVGELLKTVPRESVVVQTKYPSGETSIAPSDDLVRSLRGSLSRLGTGYVDVYIVQGPLHSQAIASVASGLASCVKQGLVRAIGVADFDSEELASMDDELAMYNIPLTLYQTEWSMVREGEELKRRLETCKEREIAVQSYVAASVLGREGHVVPPTGTYRSSEESTISLLNEVASMMGKGMASVLVNQSMLEGVLPVVTVKNEEEAQEVLDAFGWRLDASEMKKVEDLKR